MGQLLDGHNFNGKASEMKVTERWREFVDNPTYLSLFDDEVVELSKRIFQFAPPEIINQIGKYLFYLLGN